MVIQNKEFVVFVRLFGGEKSTRLQMTAGFEEAFGGGIYSYFRSKNQNYCMRMMPDKILQVGQAVGNILDLNKSQSDDEQPLPSIV